MEKVNEKTQKEIWEKEVIAYAQNEGQNNRRNKKVVYKKEFCPVCGSFSHGMCAGVK